LSALAIASLLIGSCGSNQAEKLTPEPSAKVDKLFGVFVDGVQPGAAVMIIRNGQIVHAQGYGFARLDAHDPIGPNTAFRLGSVSKQFTALAILQLAEQGKVSFDDLIGKYVPELAVYDGVTLRHLMTHTGGLPDYYDVIDTSKGMPSNADAAKLLGEMARPVFPAGDHYEYSNPGYDVLANVVEAVTGLSLAEYSKRHIFEPAGMHSTVIHDHHLPTIANRAIGYDASDDGFVPNDENALNGIVGSGGVYSTLNDMYRYDQALYGETLISQSMLNQAWTTAVDASGEPINYGFGWRLDEYRGHRRMFHGGSWVGFRALFARYPDAGLSIVLLSNRSDFASKIKGDDNNDYAHMDSVSDIYLDLD
jgi:CubicO group peptidase (beta-lactamase class C family)